MNQNRVKQASLAIVRVFLLWVLTSVFTNSYHSSTVVTTGRSLRSYSPRIGRGIVFETRFRGKQVSLIVVEDFVLRFLSSCIQYIAQTAAPSRLLLAEDCQKEVFDSLLQRTESQRDRKYAMVFLRLLCLLFPI